MSEETNEPEEKQEHPDQILNDVENILNKTQDQVDIEKFVRAFDPQLLLTIRTYKTLITMGLSKETAEQMILILWTKLYAIDYSSQYGVFPYDDDD